MGLWRSVNQTSGLPDACIDPMMGPRTATHQRVSPFVVAPGVWQDSPPVSALSLGFFCAAVLSQITAVFILGLSRLHGIARNSVKLGTSSAFHSTPPSTSSCLRLVTPAWRAIYC